MQILGCYNDGRKKIFNLLFIFLSLFSWTPRDRLVNDPGALHVRRPDSRFVHSAVMIVTALSCCGARHLPQLSKAFVSCRPLPLARYRSVIPSVKDRNFARANSQRLP